MTTRSEILLASISRDALIAEVGACFNPIAPKHEGWNTKTIDVGTKSELIDKFRGHLPDADIDRIEEVDFVWRDGPLSSAVPSELHGTFDVFVASHVIEHSPDLLAFLESAETLLALTGTLILAIPDKRFCFDYFQPLAMAGDILDSHRVGRTRHTKRTIFNQHAYVVSADGVGVWGQHSIQTLAFGTSLEAAYSAFLTHREDHASPYVDTHAWQFTPASFELLLLELASLKATDWRVDRLSPIPGCEFHAWLRRGGEEAAAAVTESELNERRLALLRRTLLEAREQIEFLMPSAISGELILAAERERRLRAESSALQLRLAEAAAATDAVERERDILAAASARWFEAAVAATADNNLALPVPAGTSSRLPKIVCRLNGGRRRPSPMSLADRARDTKQWELAVRYYRDALNFRPDQPGIWVQFGHALKEAGRVSEAEAAYRKALDLDAKNADTTAALGHSLALQGKSVEAAAAYSQALALDPSPALRVGLLNELQSDRVDAPD
jgi:SAM-dependent methyltransferase